MNLYCTYVDNFSRRPTSENVMGVRVACKSKLAQSCLRNGTRSFLENCEFITIDTNSSRTKLIYSDFVNVKISLKGIIIKLSRGEFSTFLSVDFVSGVAVR